MKKTLFNRALAVILAFAMVFGALTALNGVGFSTVSASGKDFAPTEGNDPNAVLDKNAWLTEDGTYTIELSAFTKGDVEINTSVSTVPVDVILLIDQSYSMADHGTILGRSFDCYHTTAIKQAARKLVRMLSASATETANHRMAIAAYGCESTLVAQYFPEIAGSVNRYPYAGSELFVGENQYRYNGNNSFFGYDPSTRTIVTQGIDYYDNGNNGGYPYSSAQAHYGEAMRDVRTQRDELLASINAYNPNPDNPAERGGTAMHVGMKMVEGIMDAYRPNPATHENMYFKPDPDMPRWRFVQDSSAQYWFFFPDANGASTAYVEDLSRPASSNRAVTCYPHDANAGPYFYLDDNGPDPMPGAPNFKGYSTYGKAATRYSSVRGNWLKGYWVENDSQIINGVKVYGTWENRKKVVIIFTDGYVGDTAFRPDWANMCMESAGRIKNGTYGEAATVYTVGLIWDAPEQWIHEALDVAWQANPNTGLPADVDDGLYRHWIYYRDYGMQFFDTGEYFPTHFFDNPHESLLKKFLGYLSSNYIPNAQGQFPTQAVQYIGGYNPTLIVSNHDNGFRDPNLRAAQTSGGLFIDNYFIDAHNTLSDPNTADIENIDRLVDAFQIISSEIITIESANGSFASLSANSILRDYLSNYFQMPDNFDAANITVSVEDCIGISGEDYTFGNKRVYSDAVVAFNAEEGMVEVSNINYEACGIVNNVVRGNKVTVTVTGILACDFAVGDDLPTNDASTTGIYADGSSAEPGLKFPLPKVDIREKYVVYDFSTTLAEESSHEFFGSMEQTHDVLKILTLDDCYKSQRNASGGITYHTAFPYEGCSNYNQDKDLYACSIIGSAQDNVSFKPKSISERNYVLGALLKCDPAKNDGVEYEWCKLTFLPATNVHYEEDCLDFYNGGGQNPTVWSPESSDVVGNWQLMSRGASAGNQSSANGGLENEYGYCGGYANGGHEDSNGSSMHVKVDLELLKSVNQGRQWPMVSFRFTGTGFDLISHSGTNTGVFSVDVVPHGENPEDSTIGRHLIVDTYYENNAYLYQIPILRVVDLEYLDEGYDVYIRALYHPVFDNPNRSGVIEAGTIPGLPENIEYEFIALNPECERHGTRLGDGYFDAFIDAVRIYNPRGVNLTASSGVDYEAYYAANELNPTYTQIRSMLLADENSDTSALYIDGTDGNISLEQYRAFGPNNEVYLWAAPNGHHADKAIAFTVANWNAETTRVHISAKAPAGVVSLYANGIYVGDVQSATELYFDITDILRATTDSGHVVISAEQAQGSQVEHPVLSLVNVKVMDQSVAPSGPERFTVTWVDGISGSVLKTKLVRTGDVLAASDFPTPPDHSAEGYVFESWTYNNMPITSNLTITARYAMQSTPLTVRFWDQVTQQYIATWTGIARGTVLNTADFPAAPEHEGYNFIGHSYTEGTPLYADTTIIYEYMQSSGSDSKVIVNLNVNPGHQMLQGTQVLFDKDHNTFGTETIPYYVPASGQQVCYPQQGWYDAAEYLIPTNAGPDGPYAESGSQITSFEIDPGTYDLFVLTKQTTGWFWRSGGGHDDLVLTAGMVVNIYYDYANVVVSYGSANSVQPAPDGAELPTRGGSVQLASGAPHGGHPIYADIETFNFAEAILAGVRGDANHDRRLDMADALLVMRRALGCEIELDAYGRYCADFNRDCAIDVTDALNIMRSALAIID